MKEEDFRRTISSVFTFFLGAEIAVRRRVSPRFLQSGSRGENQNEHKGASRSQRELERVVLASSLSLPSFFPPNVEKSIPELSFRFVSFRLVAVPRQFLLDCSGQVELLCLCSFDFPTGFPPSSGITGPIVPSPFSLGENGGRTMYRADKRKWPEKGKEEGLGEQRSPPFDVCFENCSRFYRTKEAYCSDFIREANNRSNF